MSSSPPDRQLCWWGRGVRGAHDGERRALRLAICRRVKGRLRVEITQLPGHPQDSTQVAQGEQKLLTQLFTLALWNVTITGSRFWNNLVGLRSIIGRGVLGRFASARCRWRRQSRTNWARSSSRCCQRPSRSSPSSWKVRTGKPRSLAIPFCHQNVTFWTQWSQAWWCSGIDSWSSCREDKTARTLSKRHQYCGP